MDTKTKIRMRAVLGEVENERVRQNEKWGLQDHNPVEWIAILTEEVGEAAKEAVDMHLENINRVKQYRKEVIQAAAVAVQMVESLDRQLEQEKDESLPGRVILDRIKDLQNSRVRRHWNNEYLDIIDDAKTEIELLLKESGGRK